MLDWDVNAWNALTAGYMQYGEQLKGLQSFFTWKCRFEDQQLRGVSGILFIASETNVCVSFLIIKYNMFIRTKSKITILDNKNASYYSFKFDDE
ncbi:hypothetical protein Hanom_Chr08g00710561 [Helianthus anomalus]